MRSIVVLGILLVPASLAAQRPAPADTLHPHGDTLSRPRYALPAITITAARTQREAPVSATAVSAAALQRTLATSNSAWELLRQSAGMEVHEQGQGPGFASDASVRGFSSDHSTDLALWVDGVPINEPVNGHAEGYNDWSLLFPQSISDLEVLKGPTSPLFGNFAMAGVVNIRTLERMRGSRGWLSGGSHGRLDGALLTGFDRPASGGVLGVRGQRDDGWRPNAGWTLGQAYGRLVRDLSPTTSIDAGANLYVSGWDSPGFLTLEQFDVRQYDAVADPTDGGSKRRAQERVSLRVLSGSSLLWRTTLYATQGRWSLFLTTPPEGGQTEGTGSQTEEEDRRYGFGLTSALTWQLPRTELTVGTQNRLDHADYDNWLTTARRRDSAQVRVAARQLSGSVFLQSATDVGHHVRVDVGGRYDLVNTRSAPLGDAAASDGRGVLSPKLGALWHLPRLLSIYANVSRGFRETDGVITDPALPFITAWAYETGLKLDSRRAGLTASVFRMDVSNEQTFNPLTLTSTSGGASRRQGIEVEARLDPAPRVELGTDLTLNDAKYRRFITEDGDTLSGARVFNTARFVGSAYAAYRPAGTLELRASTNVVGPYTPFDEPDVEVPAYALLHLSANVRVGRALLEAGVRNVLDRAYPEVRAGGFVSPGQPRSVLLSAHMPF